MSNNRLQRRANCALMKRCNELPAIATTGYVDSLHMFIEQCWDTLVDLAAKGGR